MSIGGSRGPRAPAAAGGGGRRPADLVVEVVLHLHELLHLELPGELCLRLLWGAMAAHERLVVSDCLLGRKGGAPLAKGGGGQGRGSAGPCGRRG